MSDNRCVICGTVIPEGGMVCPTCLKKQQDELEYMANNEPIPDEKYEKRIRRMDMVDYIMWDWFIPLVVGGFILYILFGRW